LVRINRDPALVIVCKPKGQWSGQLAAHSGADQVQFRFTHGALQSQQEAIIEVCGMVDAVLVQNERVSNGANLQQPVPVGRVSSKARDFKPENDAGSAHAHFRHQLLKTFTICSGRTRLAQVTVYHNDLVILPAKSNGALP
jgi:hypothetical protein